MGKEGKMPDEWCRVTYIYLNVILTRHSCVLVEFLLPCDYCFRLLFHNPFSVLLCRETRLKIRKMARSDQEHPTKGVKGQTWKKALMCFVDDLLRYQKKKPKGKFTFMFSFKTARNYKSLGPSCSKPQLALIQD